MSGCEFLMDFNCYTAWSEGKIYLSFGLQELKPNMMLARG
jgi:hypothetical protein